MKGLKGVLLDIDGTLLRSNEAHALAFTEAAEALGMDADYMSILRLIGKGTDKLIPEAFGIDPTSASGTKLDHLKGEIFRTRYLPHLVPSPGARPLLTKLKSEGVPLVVATSANKEDVSRLLERAEVEDLIDDTTSPDDAASKPDPDILEAALKRLTVHPEDVVMIGDTPYDIEAAQRAHVRCIALRCGGWDDQQLQGAVAIFDDPADLLAHYVQSGSLT